VNNFVNNFLIIKRLRHASCGLLYKYMSDNLFGSAPSGSKLVITLDGQPVEVPWRHPSLSAIHCFLEALALKGQRILYSLSVDGESVNLALPLTHDGTFCRVVAETAALKERSVLLLKTALQQVESARECVETAITLVIINDGCVARELWWNLARLLKEPVLTLSLLPDNTCGAGHGGASLSQLRKWQLEQVAAIIRDVDQACHSEDTIPLSNALENRVLPWLQNLSELINLWHDTAMAGDRLGMGCAVS